MRKNDYHNVLLVENIRKEILFIEFKIDFEVLRDEEKNCDSNLCFVDNAKRTSICL